MKSHRITWWFVAGMIAMLAFDQSPPSINLDTSLLTSVWPKLTAP